MIEVVVIEDRLLTLKALRESIDWAGSGVAPIGFFESCDEALPVILERQPDVVVTDIVMHGMDGIQLCERLRRDAPDTKVIIISAHSQFEYAQRALQMGVYNYFEKPVDYDELLCCVVQAGEERQYQQQLIQYVNNHMAFYRERFFIKLLLGQLRDSEASIERETRFLKLPEPCAWRCVTLTMRPVGAPAGDSAMQREMLHLLFMRQLESAFGRAHLHGPFSLGDSDLTVVFSVPLEQRDQLEPLRDALAEQIDGFCAAQRVIIHAGIGDAVDRIAALRQSYAGAKEAQEACFQFEESTALCASELPDDTGAVWYGLLQLEDQLVDAIRRGDELLAEQAFRRVREQASRQVAPQGALKLLMKSAMIKVEGFHERGSRDTGAVMSAIDGAGSMDELLKICERRCAALCESVRDARDSQRRQLIQRARDYIEQHYMSDQFCLSDVSKCVAVSPNYISSLFKKECGKGIHEYLTELRIEKARELLVQTDISVGQVGAAVGYPSPYYFSMNFKRITDYTPTEYRRRNQKN